jgi:hypothetical protein
MEGSESVSASSSVTTQPKGCPNMTNAALRIVFPVRRGGTPLSVQLIGCATPGQPRIPPASPTARRCYDTGVVGRRDKSVQN